MAGRRTTSDSLLTQEELMSGMTNPKIISVNTVLAANTSTIISHYVEVSIGITLEIGAGATLEII